MLTRRQRRIAPKAVLVSALVLAACGGSDSSDGAEADGNNGSVATEPTDTTNVTAPPTTNAEPPETTVVTTSTPVVEPEPTTTDAPEPSQSAVSFAADAPLLTKRFSFLDEGSYRVDTLGTPFSFTGNVPLSIQPNDDGFFVITDPESRGPDDADIVFMRLSQLSDPAAPSQVFDADTDGWPADDIVGWADQIADGVDASTPEATILGGLPAVRLDVEVGDIACAQGREQCVGFGMDYVLNTKYLNPGAAYRIWVVEQGDEAPLAIVAGTLDPDGSWFDTAEDVLATIAFGDIGPSPLSGSQAGPIDLKLFDGIQVTLPAGAVLSQPSTDFGRILFDPESDIDFLAVPHDTTGTPIESTDDLVTQLTSVGVEVTEVEPSTVDGLDARVFEIAMPGPADASLLRNPGDERGWFTPPLGTTWVIEHPDRGLLMITAESFFGDPDVNARIAALTTDLVATLSFTEPT